MSFAFCNVSVMSLRKEPSHRSEQVNQLLFGEKAEILKTNDKDWAYVRCLWDQYEGWGRLGQVSEITKKDYKKTLRYISSSHNGKVVLDKGEVLLPLGADLPGLKSGVVSIGERAGIFKGKKAGIKNLVFDAAALQNAAMQYLNAPYLWGGRSVWGLDCSGLTQMAFKLCGKTLPRDAAQQAETGDLVDFLEHAQGGDLAFFNNEEGKIVHVGLLIDNQTIIHCTDTSGTTVIDRIDQAGIISNSLKKRTHHLRLVRRYL